MAIIRAGQAVDIFSLLPVSSLNAGRFRFKQRRSTSCAFVENGVYKERPNRWKKRKAATSTVLPDLTHAFPHIGGDSGSSGDSQQSVLPAELHHRRLCKLKGIGARHRLDPVLGCDRLPHGREKFLTGFIA